MYYCVVLCVTIPFMVYCCGKSIRLFVPIRLPLYETDGVEY
jgi:hypothetical protein